MRTEESKEQKKGGYSIDSEFLCHSSTIKNFLQLDEEPHGGGGGGGGKEKEKEEGEGERKTRSAGRREVENEVGDGTLC